MNIGFLTTSFQYKGGIERLVVSLGDGLAKRGHRCTLFHPENTSDPYPVPNAVQRCKLPTFNTDNWLVTSKRIIQGSDFDVFCILSSTDEGCLLLSICKGMGIPIVWSEHSSPYNIEVRYWNRLGRLASISCVDAIHLLCKDFLASIPPVLQNRVTIIPNFPYIKDVKNNKSLSRKKRLLSVARLNEGDKRLSFIILAFEKLNGEFSDWECRICGEGPSRDEYERLIIEHKLEGRVKLAGNIEDIGREYASADLFVLTSPHEGFGLAVAEAQCFGLPCVGFASCSGVNEIIVHGETGLLAPEMTVECLTDQLRLLMGDGDLRQRMGSRAKELSVRYDRECVLDMWESMLRDAANKKAPLAVDRLDSLDDPKINGAKLHNGQYEMVTMSHANPKISVIIPIFNTAPWLMRCLDSVCGQTFKDIEILCINDGSSDASYDIINEYANLDKRIVPVHLKCNRGVSIARNIGMAKARGEWLAFVDSDDTIEPFFYEKLISVADTSNAEVVKGVHWSERKFPYPVDLTTNEQIRLDKLNFTTEWISAIYKKKLLRDNRILFLPFCTNNEDCVFQYEVAFFANKFETVDHALYYYTFRKNSAYEPIMSYKKLKSAIGSQAKIIDFINRHIHGKEQYVREYINRFYCCWNYLNYIYPEDRMQLIKYMASKFEAFLHSCRELDLFIEMVNLHHPQLHFLAVVNSAEDIATCLYLDPEKLQNFLKLRSLQKGIKNYFYSS